ncbi:MAG: hypothetical protein LKJ13_01815 [Clostridia bacterium]|jgi:hypothetical protein|nr:hypothetical protein [Clostridia bacterium]MCI1999015.1 hypothetical protein [Clostridia bacterium]MCI2013765.1 hypothetical protein [Clostridia bacterium]
MSIKIHASSEKAEDLKEFLRINKPIIRAGAKVKQKHDGKFYHAWILSKSRDKGDKR